MFSSLGLDSGVQLRVSSCCTDTLCSGNEDVYLHLRVAVLGCLNVFGVLSVDE
jgi:hypothetical protein